MRSAAEWADIPPRAARNPAKMAVIIEAIQLDAYRHGFLAGMNAMTDRYKLDSRMACDTPIPFELPPGKGKS